ncbi:MAG TPA: xylulose 5-phosphate 3-epimerase [Micropepsaceae bacterium]|nr:xylulose 5-phosphate 3-epimerase [Micropepsaceae bacterium]
MGMTRPEDDGSVWRSWAAGTRVISHAPALVRQARALARKTGASNVADILWAADRIASAAMRITAHMSYANRLDPAGRALTKADFKAVPEGHLGGSLNVAIAYAGYMAANAISGITRSWLLGQGHCVAGIEAVNALTGNLSPAQARRYRGDEGLNILCRDFYSYAQRPDGAPAAPLGSHVNPHTGGGISEGGYLGFAETQYVHMPLPGERLVAFLSDGAFEEQRGGDWSPRWWRAEDCGLVTPILILNGRRIEQRTGIIQDGGMAWLKRHLVLNGFDPIVIDGRDPAAYALAILEAEARLSRRATAIAAGKAAYPAPLPYVVAQVPKGFGFAGAGSMRAHNLPLEHAPGANAEARAAFNESVRNLFIPPADLAQAQRIIARTRKGRVAERDHPLASRHPPAPVLPKPANVASGAAHAAMAAIDDWFIRFVRANPHHRFRVANPDELRSNQMGQTLDLLKHRAVAPEKNAPESVTGAVITVLNEEAVIGAALGNKGGISLAVTYEAFAVKMLGALRQDIIFARQQKEAGRPPQWIGMPLIVTSHTWENGKNQQSHQDPTIAEALLAEASDCARVIFPVDAQSAVAALRMIYASRGVISCIVAPKRETPVWLSPSQAQNAVTEGAIHLKKPARPDLQLIAIGAYQLAEAMQAASRLEEKGLRVRVTAIIEPARFRIPRDRHEEAMTHNAQSCAAMFPQGVKRIVLSHTRPEAALALLRRVDEGKDAMRALGYINRGGTLDTHGMLFANRATWAHVVAEAAALLGRRASQFLSPAELRAVEGRGDPASLRKTP